MRVGPWLRTSPQSAVSFAGNQGKTCGKELLRALVKRCVHRTVSPTRGPALFDALGEGTPGEALGLQGRERVMVCKQECALEFCLGGVVCGMAGGEGFPVPGHGARMDGKAHEELIVASGRHHGPFMKFQAHRARASAEARAQGLAPRVNGFRAMCEAQELPPRSARDVSADIVLSSRPIEADQGGACCVYHTCHV